MHIFSFRQHCQIAFQSGCMGILHLNIWKKAWKVSGHFRKPPTWWTGGCEPGLLVHTNLKTTEVRKSCLVVKELGASGSARLWTENRYSLLLSTRRWSHTWERLGEHPGIWSFVLVLTGWPEVLHPLDKGTWPELANKTVKIKSRQGRQVI